MKDFISDMVTRIKNGQKVQLSSIKLNAFSPKYCLKILDILKEEGFIYGYFLNEKENKQEIVVYLKYNNVGVPVIKNIFRVSTPGRRIYASTNMLWKPKTTTGVFIISTPKGLYTDRDARLLNLGGEILLGIY